MDTTDRKYTLVLDLDETLVHYFDVSPSPFYTQLGAESHFLIRPGCFEFLEEMAKYYELVIFTAAMQDVRLSIFNFFSTQTQFLTKSTRIS